MEERRRIDRVNYQAQNVMVVCDTQEKILVVVQNMSPMGMGLKLPADCPQLIGKDVIIVADALIMYAEVLRQELQEDGTYAAGIQAKKFSESVLQYLSEHIG